MSVASLLLGDSRFPAGGHAHSGGVEPAVTARTVTDLDSLELFLRGRLRTTGLVTAAVAAAACEHARVAARSSATSASATSEFAGVESAASGSAAAVRTTGQSPALIRDDYWDQLDAETDARTPAPAQREASRRQGRALLRAARVAWPDAPWLAELVPSAGGGGRPEYGGGSSGRPVYPGGRPEYRGGRHHPVVLGAAAAAAGCEPPEAARIAAYQAVAGPVSAAVRLLALDPMRATGILARLSGDIDRIAERGGGYATGAPEDLPCPSAPALDLLAETHIRAEVRLFES